MRQLSLILIFVDLISPIFELKSKMLNSSIIQFFPIPFINKLQQLILFLLRHNILNNNQPRNSTLNKFRLTIRHLNHIRLFHKLLLTIQKYQNPRKILIINTFIKYRLILHILLNRQVLSSRLFINKIQNAISMTWNYVYVLAQINWISLIYELLV